MKLWHWIALAILTAISLAAQLLGGDHAHWWERIPGFWAVFGFIGCVLIIVISKALGKHFIQKPEDYYREP